jgi:hypothetical protein
MARPEAKNTKKAETKDGFSKKESKIANIFKPVARLFGWVAKGSEKKPLCRT